jgi:hypothetical protein
MRRILELSKVIQLLHCAVRMLFGFAIANSDCELDISSLRVAFSALYARATILSQTQTLKACL